MLEMKDRCKECDVPLTASGNAYICSFECTFCVDCCTVHGARCPDCGGELVRRPRRQEASNSPD
ncbi:hypothetical protein A11A3_02537 [Alcanivorax hongdengensis A-11-3]|uniref:Alginate lyase n=1 Tax=Alcanivorax hongdengensis A-11-3 TaxID=1177179 RepID=L0WIP0_9GAMM|nr:DUF1272 domain-containing protein [Alcanivorax hongdengensis]EKF75710.1 hypothetical protein A11A3_02537 [Alcanivorax hongdengensis A-11-3]